MQATQVDPDEIGLSIQQLHYVQYSMIVCYIDTTAHKTGLLVHNMFPLDATQPVG